MDDSISSANLSFLARGLTESISPSPVMQEFTSTDPASIDDRKLKEACSEFESLFIYHLLKNMRDTIPKSDLFSMKKGEEDIYNSMIDRNLAGWISSQGGVGLAAFLQRQIPLDD